MGEGILSSSEAVNNMLYWSHVTPSKSCPTSALLYQPEVNHLPIHPANSIDWHTQLMGQSWPTPYCQGLVLLLRSPQGSAPRKGRGGPQVAVLWCFVNGFVALAVCIVSLSLSLYFTLASSLDKEKISIFIIYCPFGLVISF